ncbi:hypothetical protein UFOVP916_17 [uncultured Caudovirales phage]|uniref:Uncharacterized protein n=1 Tax=uncultured Caudovirales phage TaxID=2100421 RepID=A0A6J5Q435_9CAUD|nr:hypothetical protein UFOVP827_38 [uncultured Caudovirales phage]CAB4171441.1 hypothetical protein UFOVP916_17 [uncultured Caudovirales phage]CAB4177407.1 hypothetical protein UFOVP1001_41 [uncultured Caudovirales phage]CAB4199318.1 hypothetical protein UFOVP1338_35 [uncultured Caudovirales phage]CAB4213438.1 hypothetical protein UFOVP1447_30 [uncultured Caudovirales phage]
MSNNKKVKVNFELDSKVHGVLKIQAIGEEITLEQKYNDVLKAHTDKQKK